MEILINGNPADITLDTEKNLGEVLSGLELWISSSGHRIYEVRLNGKEIPVDTLNEIFDKELSEIKKLEIKVNLWRELALEALETLHDICTIWAKSTFEERENLVTIWEGSPASRFMVTDMQDIELLRSNSFKGQETLTIEGLIFIIDERKRELNDPVKEINNIELLTAGIKERMEELPLDMQTGKDKRAAETIQLFSQIGEKLFRLYFIFSSEGFSPEDYTIDNVPVKTFITEFKSAISELSDAYANQDTVLAGDIAEYELSPRLWNFYTTLKEYSNMVYNISSGS